MNTQQKKILKSAFPELAGSFEYDNGTESLAKILNSVSMMKGDKGDKGEAGYTPVHGKDYMTPEEKDYIIFRSTPKKGQDYFTKDEISSFIDDITPVKGVDYVDGKKGERGMDGIDGKDGKDGSTDEPADIVKKISSLKGKQRLDISSIQGAAKEETVDSIAKKIEDGMAVQDGRIKLIDQRWHGGGLSKVIHDNTLTGDGTGSNPLSVVGGGGGSVWQAPQTPVGLIDGTNTIYTVTYTPVAYSGVLTLNGKVYDELIDWTISGSIITFATPLPSHLSTGVFRFKGQI